MLLDSKLSKKSLEESVSKEIFRKFFGKAVLKEVEVPNLIYQQIKSYNDFLQWDKLPEQRLNEGLEALFRSCFPVSNPSNTATVSFIEYHIDQPEHSPEECRILDATYSGSIKIILEVRVIEEDKEYIKRQHAYIGDIPLMTNAGTFVINGIERVVISQFHRSPGLFFEVHESESVGKVHLARIIPEKSSWIDFEIDSRQQMSIIINKKRLKANAFIMSILPEVDGQDHREILMQNFYSRIDVIRAGDLWRICDYKQLVVESALIPFDLYDKDDNLICSADSNADMNALASKDIYIRDADIMMSDLFSDVVLDGNLICELGKRINIKTLAQITEGTKLSLIHNHMQWGRTILNCITSAKFSTKQEALSKVCASLKVSDTTRKGSRNIIEDALFDPEKYNLSVIGRMKLNDHLNTSEESLALTRDDIILIAKKLILISNGRMKYDSPDSLQFRRIRLVGELVKNQLQQSISKLCRSIQDKLGIITKETTVSEIINSRYFVATIREFFGTSQLSQFMDQTNPLSELSHKRRISAFGAGGISRDRAWLELRDLHQSHYGRICVAETPEGNSIGLINSMAIFAKTDEYGFLTTPYYRVIDQKVTNEIVYLSASQEAKSIVAYLDMSMLNSDLTFNTNIVHCRRENEYYPAHPREVEFIDVSPKQILSASSSLIPFLECNDAVRALMGSNMQRQALPLLEPTAPLIGTGMESIIIKDSIACTRALYSGTIVYVSSNKIIIHNDPDADILISEYKLPKFQKSNDGTVVDQIPCVEVGQKVKKDDLITNGAGVDKGEIALGRNVKIAFLSFKGHNYEDAVVISSKLVNEFTSIGITKLEISARELRQDIEKFTRDIPNVSQEFTANLDESGIVNIGTYVKPGDILVGRLTPKTDTNVSPDERLLRAIFGDKSADVKDTSLRVPPGLHGTVIDVKIFSRKAADKTQRASEIEQSQLAVVESTKKRQLSQLEKAFIRVAKTLEISMSNDEKEAFNKLTENKIRISSFISVIVKTSNLFKLVMQYRQQEQEIITEYKKSYKNILEGCNMPIDALETVKIFIATKYLIQPGDKVAGRHGNKGIISKIMPPENMPFTKDGEIVDILFTSTGISGRMNIGQILETHLGWASINLAKKINALAEKAREEEEYINHLRNLLEAIYDAKEEQEIIKNKSDSEILEFAATLKNGIHFACPSFASSGNDKIKHMLELAGCDSSGKEDLYDGYTGLKLPQKVTVGIMYIMQLRHLVEKKEHSRSVGAYSIITQQPMGGRSQMGGQRLGEMEVWSLQAYAASYILREMLTVKSDYPIGRSRLFELISQGYDVFEQKGVPESFCVLLYELRALCLNVDCLLMQNSKFTVQSIAGLENFDALKISIADADQIRSWSYGEVTKPETVHYRTLKPHPNGIFSTKIFGPTKNYCCACGRHRGQKRRGIICSKCETAVISAKVRRHRMGHIELAAPVMHIWMSKVLPSRAATTLDISITNLNRILLFEVYVITSEGVSPYKKNEIISNAAYLEALVEYEQSGFSGMTGAEAIEYLLNQIDLEKECSKIRLSLANATESARVNLVRRLKILEAFLKNNTKPSSMVLRVIPVLPPDLRPLVTLEGGRFASSDINELYRGVINRNNRLAKLIVMTRSIPGVIIRNEKRMLQEAVDALFDNARRAQPVTNMSNKRPLKSLTDAIRGKQGRFRQNLLGKRVDYSGRSVIVVGPQLKLHQCGLPKTMALELFKPFVLSRLVLRGFARTIRIARAMIESPTEEVWDILIEVTRNHVVLLNRAPTLHRLGIQAFEPVLIEGRAIQIHPLTCAAFNADFDGDQMAVHIPLSIEAQIEARLLIMSTKCILNPSNGTPIAAAAKDIVLGLYALTCVEHGFTKHEGCAVSSLEEAEMLIEQNKIRHSTPIKALVNDKIYETTAGRLKLYNALPKNDNLPFEIINKAMVGTDSRSLVHKIYIMCGEDATSDFLDKMMQLGFEYATLSGVTFSYSDLPVPQEKTELVQEAIKQVEAYQDQYNEGLIRNEERYNKITALWSKCTEKISDILLSDISKEEPGKMINPIYMMAKSGARGSNVQIRQLAGMRGLLAKADGSIHEHPIINSFIERMNSREQMLASQGARKGLTDVALRTADSGYFFRRTIDATQDCVVEIDDCGTKAYIEKRVLIRDGNKVLSLSKRVFGRVLAEDVVDENGKILFKSGDFVDYFMANRIDELELLSLKVRSPVTCEYDGPGICRKCYGYDLSTLKPVNMNIPVGVIAAQSIGEPCTQLTMKNFQTGGAARLAAEGKIVSVFRGTVSFSRIKTSKVDGHNLIISRNNILNILDTRNRVVDSYRIPHGAELFISNGSQIEQNQLIAQWDPYMKNILSEVDGTLNIKNAKSLLLKEIVDQNRGTSQFVVRQLYSSAAVTVTHESKTYEYPLMLGDIIEYSDGQVIKAGAQIIKRTKNLTKTQDIIGGFASIADLFEARIPKNPALIATSAGTIEIIRTIPQKIVIHSNDQKIHTEYTVSSNNLLVDDGDYVEVGDYLTDGRPSLNDILKIKGIEALNEHFVNEAQSIYTSQGIDINDKHLEISLRQMVSSVQIVNPGDTLLLQGDIIRAQEAFKLNEILRNTEKKEIVFNRIVYGITKAAVTEKTSFLAAASFQGTVQVLLDAAINNSIDPLRCMKASLIVGRLIPAGSGNIIRKARAAMPDNQSQSMYMPESSLSELAVIKES